MFNQYFKLKNPITLLFAFSFIFIGVVSQSKANITAQLSNNDNLKLMGIGVFQELRNDIYVGALFGPQSINNPDELKDDNVAKRMSIKFLSGYSNRKLARHWKERMAMNNSRSQWQPFTREIVGFSKLFKRALQAGDEINIDYIPGVGTQVYLNSTLFTTIEKPEFARILLNVWLGNIPPTKAFKKSIRGQDDSNTKNGYIAQYEGLQAIKGRFDDDLVDDTKVAQADEPPKESAEETKKASTKVAKVDTKKKETKKQTPKKKPPVKKEAKASTPPAQKATPTNNKKTEVKQTPKTAKPDIKPDIKLQSNIAETTPKTSNKPKAKTEPKKVASIEKKPPPPIEEDFFDADLITGSYTRDLINSIRRYQEYPRKALVDRKEGDVTAKVTINSEGEIIDIELTERSGSRILDRAVGRIIKKAAPFQAIPKELKQKEFVFDVPISFQL
ncbi:TonB family protein [Aliikangiella sp. IMCC44359]|uniref:TonB family protein n=1 Tax=Aliikangiella sp. IMCC44359 TaxID=3459125 RepID=UPI00403B3818